MLEYEFDKDDLATMPLHDITKNFGTAGLLERFDLEIEALDEPIQEQLEKALKFVSQLHLEDERSAEPYLNHLLRVCMRIKVHYGVTDPDILVAALLHDAVEDHAKDIIGKDLGSDEDNKRAALGVVTTLFNPRVAELIKGVTNPEFDPNRDMKEQYFEHLEELVTTGEPGAIIIKLSDFTDNATGINYSKGPKLIHWAKKYLPVVPLLKHALQRDDLPLKPEIKNYIEGQLDLTEERLTEILREAV